MNVEKRISHRRALKTRVVFEDELSQEFLYMSSTDVSVSGIFLETHLRLAYRTKVFIRFSLYEGDSPISVTGEVMRSVSVRQAKKKGLLGVGVHFLGLKVSDLKKIRSFVLG